MQVGDNKQHDMSEPEPQPAGPPPGPPFQFSLRTLLLLFVVLGSSLGVFGAWGIVALGLVVGLAVYLNQAESFVPLGCLAIAVIALLCLIFALPQTSHVTDANRASFCRVNIREIAFALQRYHEEHGSFPPGYIADKSGKPIHSWRVLLLPYLENDPLYKAYDFTQPWDGPKNRKLTAVCLREFVCPSDYKIGPGQTSYVAVVGRRSMGR